MKDKNVLFKLHKKRVLAMSGIWFTSSVLNVLFVILGWPKLLSVLQNIERWTKTYSILVFVLIFVVGFLLTDGINRIVQKRITQSFDARINR